MSLYKVSTKYLSIFLNKNYKYGINKSLTLKNNVEFIDRNINSCRTMFTGNRLLANISFNLTDIGEGIREVVVKEWFVKVGDQVAQFDNICEVQSDKASVTITSRYDGVVTKLHHNIDATALVGQPLVDIETAENKSEATTAPTQLSSKSKDDSSSSSSSSSSDADKIICIPSVRRLGKEYNINLANVKGTGKNGRILKEDVLKFLETPKTPEPVGQTVSQVSNISVALKDRSEPLRGYTKAMIKSMTEAMKIPHFGFCDEISVKNIIKIQKTLKEEALESGVKLTLMPLLIKAVSNCLHKYPILNSSLDVNAEKIIFRSSHNISVAMDTSMGLAVPVIHNVDKLTIIEIAKELNRLIVCGKKGQFSREDLANGTFCVSNIGVIGGTYAYPIILPPQVAILAFGAMRRLPRFDLSDNVIAEEIINISGSADHRIIDGATIARFTQLLKKMIENPYLLLLHV